MCLAESLLFLFPHLLQLINSNPHLPSVFILLMLSRYLTTFYTVFNIIFSVSVRVHAFCTTSAIHTYSPDILYIILNLSVFMCTLCQFQSTLISVYYYHIY